MPFAALGFVFGFSVMAGASDAVFGCCRRGARVVVARAAGAAARLLRGDEASAPAPLIDRSDGVARLVRPAAPGAAAATRFFGQTQPRRPRHRRNGHGFDISIITTFSNLTFGNFNTRSCAEFSHQTKKSMMS